MKEFTHSPYRLGRCFNIADLRRVAQRRLPAPIFHYLDGGAEDEFTLQRNTDAFDDYELMPRCLSDVNAIDLSTTLLGRRVAMPFLLAPTGMSRLFHHGAESAVALAAQQFGTFYSLSTMGTTRLEDIAALGAGPWIFQIYIFKDRGLTRELVERCKAAKYHALCLTVDTPLAGNRERDRVTGMTMPPRLAFKSFFSFASHPRWSFNLLSGKDFQLGNVGHRVDVLSRSTVSVIDYVNSQFDRTVTWDDVAALIRDWGGPFIIKGLQSVADAKRAVDLGATAIMISNHGGRQLDGVPAPVDRVMAIREAVGASPELVVDGGIRRGTHILKALALGANACSIGRAYLFGLAAAGHRGVVHALGILRAELERDLALLGCTRVADLDCRFVQPRLGRSVTRTQGRPHGEARS